MLGYCMEEDIKQKIQATALEIFEKNGYRESNIMDIAKKSHVAIRTIYKYFGSKKGLFDSLGRPELMDLRPVFDEKRHKILIKASSVFATYGYEGTSMESIAEKCNFSKALLYQYFGSKEEIFRSILIETKVTLKFEDELTRAIETGEDCRAVLLRIAISYIQLMNEPNRVNMIHMCMREPGKIPSEENNEIAKVMETARNSLAHYLGVLKKQGKIRCKHPDFAAHYFFNTMLSSLIIDHLILRSKRHEDAQSVAKKTVDLFLDGIGKA